MKNRTRIALICALVPALLCGCLTSSSGSRKGEDEHRETTPKAPDEYPDYRVVVGYMPNWSGKIADIEMDRLTHVNYAFHVTSADGGIGPTSWVMDNGKWSEKGETDDQRLHALVKRGHENGVKVLLAVGGANDKNFPKFVTDSAKLKHFFSEVKRSVEQYGLDGIDIDWEYPDNEAEGKAFTKLMKGVRRTLDAIDTNLLLTAAVGASMYGASNVTLEGVQQCDWINVMTYDYTGGWSSSTIGPTAPMSFVKSGTEYWHNRGVSYARMALGVPFYGIRFTMVGSGRVGASQVGINRIANVFDVDRSRTADTLFFKADTAHVAPGDTARDGSPYVPADTTWLYYWDSPNLVSEKVDYAMSRKMRGLMIWELSQDLHDSLSLLGAMWDRIVELQKTPEFKKAAKK